jgi:hypothetical protein
MINLRRLLIVSLAAVLLVAPGAARAQGLLFLDQSQTTGGVDSEVSGNEFYAQTFTAGRSGNLVRVDLRLRRASQASPQGPITVQISRVGGVGEPSGSALATESLMGADVPVSEDWVTFRFDRSAPSIAGTQYAIVASAPLASPPNFYVWDAGEGDLYQGGQGLQGTAGNPPSWEPVGGDMTFRTYVEPSPVGAPPDPAQKIADLRALLESLGLPPGLAKRLQKKLARALAALTSDNTARACRSLRRFLKRIATQRGKKLTVAQAQQLSAAASDLRASLGCGDARGDDDRDDDELGHDRDDDKRGHDRDDD